SCACEREVHREASRCGMSLACCRHREPLCQKSEAPMNIIELLKQQHQEAKKLLEQIIEGDDKREQKALLGEVGKALRLHMQIEEKMVYPTAARAFQGDEEDEKEVLEAFEEHAVARRALENLEKTPASDKRFAVRAKVLLDLLEHHIEEEEGE